MPILLHKYTGVNFLLYFKCDTETKEKAGLTSSPEVLQRKGTEERDGVKRSYKRMKYTTSPCFLVVSPSLSN
jgi:hypothetical protein